MVKVEVVGLENDYKIAQELIKDGKYVKVVVHLEKVLKEIQGEVDKDILKKIYQDIIFSYKSINNKTRAEYYMKKAKGIFKDFKEVSLEQKMKQKDNFFDEEMIIDDTDILEENKKIQIKDFHEVELLNDDNFNILEEEKKISIIEEEVKEEIVQVKENDIESEVIEEQGGEEEAIVIKNVKEFEMLKQPFKVKANDTNDVNFNNIFVEIFTAVESRKYFGYFKLNLNKLNEVLSKGLESLEKDSFNRLSWEVQTLLSLIEKNGITSFDGLYNLEFEEVYEKDEFEKNNNLEEQEELIIEENKDGTFKFEGDISVNSEEVEKGIDKIVEKTKDIFNSHNEHFEWTDKVEKVEEDKNIEEELENSSVEFKNEILNKEEIKEEIYAEIIKEEKKADKVNEENLEVSSVKDVVLEVLENLRKADLDIFTELKVQADERAEKVGLEKEKKGLVSGLEGMLEIKFGVASLDIVPEIEKIKNLERLYEMKEKILETRSFQVIEQMVESSEK